MKPRDALDQVAYMRHLIDQTRVWMADGYLHFLIWGGIWVIGYLASISMGPLVWGILIPVGIAVSMVAGYRYRKRSRSQLGFRLARMNTLLFIMAVVILGLFVRLTPAVLNAYWPLVIGVSLMLNGLFIGRVMFLFGLGLALAGIGSLLMPLLLQHLWLGIVGGGGLFTMGLLLRNQARTPGEIG